MKLPVIQDEQIRQAFNILESADFQNVKRNQDLTFNMNRLILTAPNGTKYHITVNNLGVITAVAI